MWGNVLTRRDQVQAYRFAQARVQSALLAGDPDLPDSPLRRAGIATLSGVMVAVLVVAGFGIYGLIRPAGKKGWDASGVLVVERDTGTRFVYDPHDEALHPVLNYTSARLILDSADITVKEFARASLSGVHRGAARGIAGLPDGLPAAAGLVRDPWAVCSGPVGGDRAGGGSVGGAPVTRISVGTALAGTPLGTGRAFLVRTPGGKTFLVWHDTRLEIPAGDTALPALGLDAGTPFPVSAAWVNSVAPGPDLTAPVPLDIGTDTGYSVGDRRMYLGQLLKVPLEGGVGTRYYEALKDGLAPVSDVVALLLLGDPTMKAAYGNQAPEAFAARPAEVASAPHSSRGLVVDGLPATVPHLVQPPSAGGGQPALAVPCAAYADDAGSSASTAVQLAPALPSSAAVGADGAQRLVRILLPAGSASLVRLVVHGGQESASVFLVTEAGAKFPIPSGGAQRALGYGDVTPVPLPKGIVDLIPTGPALDRARANTDVPLGGGGPTSDG